MDCSEDQGDEREALRSIYEVDGNFIEVNATTFQYKFGEDGHYKSFLLEISWPHDYPASLPIINLDAFYNKHISPEVKENIKIRIKEQCEMCLGTAMTYSIFDWAKEHEQELMEGQCQQVGLGRSTIPFCIHPKKYLSFLHLHVLPWQVNVSDNWWSQKIIQASRVSTKR